MPKRILGLVGTVIATIGAVTLPEDLGTWEHRLNQLGKIAGGNPLSVFAIVVGLALLVYANWNSLARFFGRRRWRTDEDLGNELHDWLRRAQYQLQEIGPSDLAVNVKLVFGFVATDPLGNRPVTVLRVDGTPGILLQSRVQPTDESNHRKVIEGMTSAQKSELTEDLGIELTRFGLGFYAEDILEGVVISHGLIPNDSLTPWQFMEQVGRVSRAILLVQSIVSRHVRLANAATAAITNTTEIPKLLGDSKR